MLYFADAEPTMTIKKVSDALVGHRVRSVEVVSFNAIKIIFDDGRSVTFTSSGAEGEDLDLRIDA